MIIIKPHHLVDIITDFGAGITDPEPHPYGHAVHSVTREILANPDVELGMEWGADDICRPCRHNLEGLCDDVIDTSYRPAAPKSKREWNLLLDRRWSERLGLRPDERLTAREFCARLRDRAGDVSDIYRELPGDRIATRQANLELGVRKLLEKPAKA
ncbi:MAG TPA: hypothetical protein PKN80_02140 [bacterium]|uniref:Uncharacterized protein n=1 Tax=candidate division TA06 bacterium ADurb.Bin417 TaxID=1852828 RepID=A0A1V5M8E8_UNCT6|nr:MAG: hypothetical protein BWY73_01510 [candidate division TA06 bacterium ADurb.Bin417]HNQ34844.1 hypothetical protein [bacterium]HNS48289.1 hypothetical protein [bacterium]